MSGATDPVDVVVGAGSGMGAAVARAIAGDRTLLVADRNLSAARATADSAGDNARAVQCDVTDVDAVADLAAQVPRLGRLVITAGLSPTMGTGQAIYEVNLVGMARVLDALDGALTGGAAAVCFASIAGHLPPLPEAIAAILDDPLAPDLPGRLASVGIDPSDPGPAYGLSKHGVLRLVRRLGVPWGRRGARILSISPGIIDTPMGRQELDQQDQMQPMIDASALGRMGTDDEVAAVAAFLTSPAASFMTGCDVLVDGGFVSSQPQ
jgi:NAD(P)-dependent dehydrogenase (short-subunit alcohol dehydrogenase family)